MSVVLSRCRASFTVVLVGWLATNSVNAVSVYSRSDFDGITPLSYATVDVGSENLPLCRDNPISSTTLECKLIGYAVTGSTVAIDEVSGKWSHVQYIGKTNVVEGWAETAHLRPLALRLPADDGPPGHQDPRIYPEKWRIRVALLKGNGVPVCEAYLQRLNQTWFYEPPYCGRPENDQIPGFTRLHAASLSASEVNRLIVPENNLVSPGLTFATNPGALTLAESSTSAPVYLDTQGVLAAVRPGENISVWRYVPAPDIDNDGAPDNVIFWRDGNRPVWERCGGIMANARVNLEGPIALFLTAGNSGIDVAKTLGQMASLASPLYSGQSYSIGVFEYRGEYYVDAVIGGELRQHSADKTQTPEESREFLHVFHRKDGHLEHACKLANSDLASWRTE